MPTKKTTTKKQTSSKKSSKKENYKLRGEDVVKKVKALIKEGNIRRIVIKNSDGEIIMEIPVTFAVLGAVLAPLLAAIGAAAALLSEVTIEVEKK